jgi:membrane-bound ClpP family serine protease
MMIDNLLFEYLVWDGLQVFTVVLLLVGIGLIVAEFFIPGFGICGTLGIVCLVVDIFLTARTLTEGLIMFVGIVAVLTAITAIFIRLTAKGKVLKGMILKADTSGALGYNSSDDFSGLVGRSGLSLTTLRPVGEVELDDGKRLDVVTQGEWVSKGSTVEIIAAEGNRIVVKSVKI